MATKSGRAWHLECLQIQLAIVLALLDDLLVFDFRYALVAITVERLEDGEVSPYLVDELRVGDRLELRGPIGGYFVWEASLGGPLLLVAGGSGIVPLMAMLRHRRSIGSRVPTRLLYSSQSQEQVIYREERDDLRRSDATVEVYYILTDRSRRIGPAIVAASIVSCCARWPGRRNDTRSVTSVARRHW
jgi:ferredoxin-NADP reductase